MTPDEARAALANGDEAAVRAAIKVCSGEEVYAAMRFPGRPVPFLWEALAEEPAKADPRWLDTFTLPVMNDGATPYRGSLALIYAMARDPDDETAERAFRKLYNMLHNGEGLAVRGWACGYLAELQNPRATPELVEEMTRTSVGSAMGLYCIPALERCGDGTALPTLRAVEGPFAEMAAKAIAAIESRFGRLDFEEVRRLRAHPDPTIADLARRTQLGEEDAHVVLEDALRERANARGA